MADQKNLLLAIVISVIILFGWQAVFPPPEPPPADPQQAMTEQQPGADTMTPQAMPQGMPSAPGGPAPAVSAPTPGITGQEVRAAVLEKTGRVSIVAPHLKGSLSLKGGRIDDLTLLDYRETLDEDSPNIVLLSPTGAQKAYFADFGWVASGAAGVTLPTAETVWTADRDSIGPGQAVILTWDNGEGLTFTKTIALDEHYMFAITQSVTNATGQPVVVTPYGLVSRYETPETTGFYILHEGLLGVFDETLEEVDYEDIKDDKLQSVTSEKGGWIGITDKYWLTALIPDQTQPMNGRFLYQLTDNQDRYQADFVGLPVTVAAGGKGSATAHLFAGAKKLELLDSYEAYLGVANFDLAIDFGWFYFLTKPIFIGLLYINNFAGNLGVSILLLTVLIKALFFPLANTSYRAMSKMKKLQPEVQKLQERFKEDKTRLNQEMMALYKKEKANPAAGCLPLLIQIPVFFALYKVLFVTIEMRQAPFFGWIQDLSAPDPTSLWNLFGLIPWDPTAVLPPMLNIGIWPLIMGGSMYLQQKLNPAPTDPIQAKIFMFLPILFTFMLAGFPAGLVIYWAWNNVLSIAQQWVIMRRMGVSA